ATVASPGPQTNTATVTQADQFDPNTANNSASVTETQNKPPVITAGHTVGYSEQQAAVPVDVLLAVSDDGATLDSATITISSGFVSGDMLSFDTAFASAHGISGGYANGHLTFSGTASTADYQTLLQSV